MTKLVIFYKLQFAADYWTRYNYFSSNNNWHLFNYFAFLQNIVRSNQDTDKRVHHVSTIIKLSSQMIAEIMIALKNIILATYYIKWQLKMMSDCEVRYIQYTADIYTVNKKIEN